MNCCYSIKLIPIRFSQEGIKSGCALFVFIPSSHGRVSVKHNDQKGDFLLSTTSIFQTAGEVVYTVFVGHVSCILIHLSHITGVDHVKIVLSY